MSTTETKYEVLRGLSYTDPKNPNKTKFIDVGKTIDGSELVDIEELLRIEAIREKGVKSRG